MQIFLSFFGLSMRHSVVSSQNWERKHGVRDPDTGELTPRWATGLTSTMALVGGCGAWPGICCYEVRTYFVRSTAKSRPNVKWNNPPLFSHSPNAQPWWEKICPLRVLHDAPFYGSLKKQKKLGDWNNVKKDHVADRRDIESRKGKASFPKPQLSLHLLALPAIPALFFCFFFCPFSVRWVAHLRSANQTATAVYYHHPTLH